MPKIKLKKDIIIPAGTIFDNVDDSKVEYVQGNFEHIFGLTKDTTGSIVYGIDPSDFEINDWFEYCE